MTLLISVFAAIICTVIWYKKAPRDEMRVGKLALMYWGASLIWLADAIYEYAELGAEYFVPAAADMLNDAYLGAAVVALGLVIWLVCLFIKDPSGKVKAALMRKK